MVAQVDVNMVLQSLGPEQIRTGEWVNVIGYITKITPPTDDGEREARSTTVQAQAVLLWSAGSFDLRRYEASIMALAPAGTTRERVAS